MKIIALLFIAGTVLIACNPKNSEVIEVITEETDNTAEVISEGKDIYAQSCQKCHGLKIVEDFTREQWDNILPGMISKAKLSEEAAFKVTEYVHWELNND